MGQWEPVVRSLDLSEGAGEAWASSPASQRK